MHRVSDIYGPIRYTKYENNDTTGEYDSQRDCLQSVF